ncbi:diacylglycerol O-acyltransferase [Myxococcaceae bacterium]|nr:diacylglycerol O-acyltransferase [Myxococcaceae bacterium]
MTAWTRLSELDRSFLIYEGPNSPMHVGAVQIFEGDPLRDASGPIDFDRILDYVGSRLHRIPRYRQKVIDAPLDGHPIWVDDARFNLRYHVRHARLPRPGDERILKRTCARILEQRLDLHKPLWELWVIEGLADGRIAVVSKIHHCMVDGVSGADLMTVLLTPEPTAKVEPPPAWIPRPAPSAVEYAMQEGLHRLGAPLRGARAIGRLASDGEARDELAERLRAAARVLTGGLAPMPLTPLNLPVGPHRRFDWLTMDLDEVSRVRKQLGGTLNDLVLTVVAGAIRRFFKYTRLTDPNELPFRVMAPVSVRDASERGRLGNRVAAWFVPLPIGESDPLERLALVRKATEELKRRHDALGAETLTQVIEWLGATPLALGARFVETRPPYHLIVTNVPGPRMALYLLGARMLEAHPMVPLLGAQSVGIALFSYGGRLSWGFNADWDLVPDLHELVLAVERSFDQLRRRADAAARSAGEARASPAA